MTRARLDSTGEVDLGASKHKPTSFMLLVVGADGTSTSHPLPERGTVTLGRGPDCDVRIDDPAVSRTHARIHVAEARGDESERAAGTFVFIEDLGSANGTRVREAWDEVGRPLGKGALVPLVHGSVIEIGTSTAMVQAAPAHGRPRRLWPHGAFEALVEKEHERTARSRASFAVLHLVVDGVAPEDAEAQVIAATRSSDTVARYGPNQLEVLVVDATAQAVEEVQKRIDARVSLKGGRVQIGVAIHPDDGRSPEGLLETARQRARGEEAFDWPARVEVLEDPAMKRVYTLVRRVAGARIAVLLQGETGVGKDVVAEAIHALSPRAEKPYVRLNCAALPENLLESELFGYEKGAFSGAVTSKQGLLEAANGGTIFLDEIGELPLATQAKLLRALEDGQVRRLGAITPRAVDVRFVAATNRDLETEVGRGAFRGDLYFRLSGVTLTIPPLRERTREIVPFARIFLRDLAEAAGRSAPGITPEAAQLLVRYAWPGNIRELRNAAERALLLCDGDQIRAEHLPVEKLTAHVAPLSRPPSMPPPRGSGIPAPIDTMRALPLHEIARARAEAESSRPTSVPQPPAPPSSLELDELRARMDEVERRRVVAALEACGGNQTKAARMLGISRGTFVARLGAFGLPRPRKG